MMKKWCKSNPDFGLLILRVAVGVIFIAHGWDKFSHMEDVIGFFSSLGLSSFWAYAVASTELVAGFVLLLGIWTTWAATLLAVIMVFAIALVKSRMNLQAAEIDFALLASTLAIVFAGPGRFALGRGRHSCCGCGHGCACGDDCGECADGTCTVCACGGK